MSWRKVRIAVQKKGRLYNETMLYLKSKGIALPTTDERELIITTNDGKYEILFVRHADIPKYIEAGVAQYGIIGQNLMYENGCKVNIVKELNFCICRLVLAVPVGSTITNVKDLEGQRIATSYPNSLRKFLRKNKIQASIIEIEGSVEACPQLGLSDAICDLVQTGNSLKENNLREISEIYRTQAVLITGGNQQETDAVFE